ncbi:MAG: hypothetical protein ACPGGK_08530 [Pikeienuella sp.]
MSLCRFILILWLIGCSAAHAGAWTRAKGDSFVARSARYFTTSTAAASGEAFSKNNSSIYVEFGLTDDMTIGVEHDAGAGSSADFIEEVETSRFFVRRSLWRSTGGAVLSSEVSNGLIFTSGDSVKAPMRLETRTRFLFGVGFDSEILGTGWFDSALGVRGYAGRTTDELRAEATVGFHPVEDWLVMTQVFAMKALTPGADQQDAISVALSLGYKAEGPNTIVFGIRQDAMAKGATRGTEASLTIWTNF